MWMRGSLQQLLSNNEHSDKQKKKSQIPSEHHVSHYSPVYCHSYGCDILIKNDNNILRNYYTFIPQFLLIDGSIQTNDKISIEYYKSCIPQFLLGSIQTNDKISIEYCESCFKDSFIDKKKNKFKKRIFACWEKDDYGFVENTKCDLCGELSKKLSRRLCRFKTNDLYLGIRNDDYVFICACNKCMKINPKNAYKLVMM